MVVTLLYIFGGPMPSCLYPNSYDFVNYVIVLVNDIHFQEITNMIGLNFKLRSASNNIGMSPDLIFTCELVQDTRLALVVSCKLSAILLVNVDCEHIIFSWLNTTAL